MEKKRKVMVGTPCRDGRTSIWYSDSLRHTERVFAEHGIELTPMYRAFDSLVQRARNDLVSDALEGKHGGMIWIDDDMRWNPLWALSLVNRGVDVVGAAYRKKTDDQEIYTARMNVPVTVDKETGLWEAISLGTGFVYTSRKALQALWDASEPYRNEGRMCRWIFDVCVVNGELVSEDNIMCEKLRQLGFKILLDPSFTPTHVGEKQYQGNFNNYVERLTKAIENQKKAA